MIGSRFARYDAAAQHSEFVAALQFTRFAFSTYGYDVVVHLSGLDYSEALFDFIQRVDHIPPYHL
jgi:hypothetical protein